MYRRSPGPWTHILGFMVGSFCGLIGLVWAIALSPEHLPGVIAGLIAPYALLAVFMVVASVAGVLDNGLGDLAWEPMAAFAIVTVWVVGTIAGGVYFLRSGDDDDEPPDPNTHRYVTTIR